MLSTFSVILLLNLYSSLHVASSTNPRTHGGRIAGGSDSDIADFPHQAALFIYRNITAEYEQICGGAIVTEKFVLTAGSCLGLDYEPSNFQVGAGASNLEDEAAIQVVPVLNFTKHPLYSGEGSNYDVAILELSSPLKLNRNSTWPAILPNAGQTWQDGTEVTLTGWGWMGSFNPKATILQQADFDILDERVCTYIYGKEIAEGMLCAGPQDFIYWNEDPCLGDEGGPLVLKGNGTVVGILSWAACLQCPFVGLYTNLAQEDIRQFIADVTGV